MEPYLCVTASQVLPTQNTRESAVNASVFYSLLSTAHILALLDSLRVKASDGGQPSKTNETLVTITVKGSSASNISCVARYRNTLIETSRIGLYLPLLSPSVIQCFPSHPFSVYSVGWFLGQPFLIINGTSTNGIVYTIEPKSLFPSHIDYVYISTDGRVSLSRPIYDTSFPSLQFVITARDRLSTKADCRTDVIMTISRNTYAPVVTPGQRTISECHTLELSFPTQSATSVTCILLCRSDRRVDGGLRLDSRSH